MLSRVRLLSNLTCHKQVCREFFNSKHLKLLQWLQCIVTGGARCWGEDWSRQFQKTLSFLSRWDSWGDWRACQSFPQTAPSWKFIIYSPAPNINVYLKNPIYYVAWYRWADNRHEIPGFFSTFDPPRREAEFKWAIWLIGKSSVKIVVGFRNDFLLWEIVMIL